MMVLPLASALGKIDPIWRTARAPLGRAVVEGLLQVTLPLSVPGLVAGFTLVFSLTAGSFVTPVILGGTTATMLGNLIEQQIFVVYDWPFGAAIAVVLVLVVFVINARSPCACSRAAASGACHEPRPQRTGAWILYFIGAADGVPSWRRSPSWWRCRCPTTTSSASRRRASP